MFKMTVVLLCTLGSAGCLTSDVLLTVRPDGSGTIRYTLKVTPSQMAELDKLFPPEAGDRPRPPLDALPEADVRLAARNAGPYVRLVESRALKSVDSVGRTMTFGFDEVDKLLVELLPELPGAAGGFYRLASADPNAKVRLTLSLAGNTDGNRVLTVRFPTFAMDPSAEPLGASVTGSPSELARLRNVVRGTRLTLTIETATPLIRTNSPHSDGNTVVLFDIDLEQALFSKQNDMLRATPASFDEYLWMMADLPGVRLADAHVITIEFQGAPTGAAAPPQPPPSTEIYLAPLERRAGRPTVGAPVNISNNDGYDNQPAFAPDGGSILFTSARGGTSAAPQMDIYRYDLPTKQVTRVTSTPESEYSPAVMPGGKRVSVVRVEADGTQRLWSFSLEGTDPAVILTNIKPVGYHAWIDEHTLGLFVLGGGGQPSTLQIADIRNGTAEVAARDIGRSIQRMPAGQVSFVQRSPRAGTAGVDVTISQLLIGKQGESRSLTPVPLVRPVPGASDPYPVWLADGSALMAHESTLFFWRPGEPDWQPIADLAGHGLRAITRLAVSPKGDRLALVAAGR